MERTRGRFDPRELGSDARFRDESEQLWPTALGEVARELLSSALRCFAANGYHATTTRDIASVVGLSPAALYVHFESKELVLYEIIRSSHEGVLTTLNAQGVSELDDPLECLSRLVSSYTSWHARHHVAARVAQFELAGLTDEHYQQILELRHETNNYFRHAVADASRAEHAPPADISRLTRAILSLSIDLVRWYELGGSDSPEVLGDFYAELTRRMLHPVAAASPPRGASRRRGRTGEV